MEQGAPAGRGVRVTGRRGPGEGLKEKTDKKSTGGFLGSAARAGFKERRSENQKSCFMPTKKAWTFFPR